MFTKILLCAVLATLAISGTAGAQQLPAATQQTATIKRTPLQKFDVPGTSYETVIGIAEIAPNVNIGRHTHPGPESGYMLDGEMVLLIDGQPEKRCGLARAIRCRLAPFMTLGPAPREQRSLRRTSSKKANRSRRRPSELPPRPAMALDLGASPFLEMPVCRHCHKPRA